MREVVFVIVPQVEILDLAGPLQVFHEAGALQAEWRIRLCSTRESLRSSQGLVLAQLDPLPEISGDALVVVAGMPYAATLNPDRAMIRWLKAAARAGAHIASVCTGAFMLGEAGLLDGKRCTTHWNRTGELRQRYPAARVVENALYVSEGNVTTSAGIASGIDMALSVIEETSGPLIAAAVAREMVVYMRRDGGHQQESIYLDYRTHLHPGIHRVQDYLARHADRRSTLEELSKVAAMSSRNLTRKFREVTGITIHEYTTRVRLEMARTLMSDPGLTIDGVAVRCGFAGARQLRRIWREAIGGTPAAARPRQEGSSESSASVILH